MTGSGDGELARMLIACGELDTDMAELLERGWSTSTQRQAICLAYCKAALEHAVSQRVLLGDGLHGTALSLIRLHFETVIRAAWVLYGAKEDWLGKFSGPVPLGDLTEPQMGPPIPAMLDAIEVVVPEAARELRRINETVKVMHSFVHGGVHLVVHALRGYPTEKLVAVLQNRNLLLLMLANVIVGASQKNELTGSVRALIGRHGSCMSPTSPRQSA